METTTLQISFYRVFFFLLKLPTRVKKNSTFVPCHLLLRYIVLKHKTLSLTGKNIKMKKKKKKVSVVFETIIKKKISCLYALDHIQIKNVLKFHGFTFNKTLYETSYEKSV